MNSEEIKSRLTPVFRKVFRAPELVVTEGLSANDVAAWDSLSHINLIIAAEKEFKIKFNTKEVRAMKNVGDMVELINQKAETQ